jgi:hypothetical protein
MVEETSEKKPKMLEEASQKSKWIKDMKEKVNA